MPSRPTRLALVVLAACAVATAAGRAQTQTPTWPREPEAPTAPMPAPAPAALAALVGEYEAAPSGGRPPVHLYLLEDGGQLFAIADRGSRRPFSFTAPGAVRRDAAKKITGVVIDGVTYTRLQVGPKGGGQLRVTPIRQVDAVLKESLGVKPPVESGTFTPADLVELAAKDSSIKLDIRYATTNNFLGSVFYSQARAFLQRPAAEAVLRVHQQLKALGYGVLIHDGYRPWYVTRTFWECTPPDRKWLVANPASGSKHNRGAAIDLSMYDLKTGAVIEMPSTYDESTPRAYAFYPGGTGLQRWHRALLRRLMEAEGFTVNPEEWWHFDYKTWQSYAIGNTPFDALK
jgi:D-alanyl-D-alanine dipeptidase